INLTANHVKPDAGVSLPKQLDIFTDYERLVDDEAREKRKAKAILKIKKRYGKNAILKGMNFEEAGTTKDRNEQIGGHRA
ncbi:MAG: DNA methylase, partial [Oscillospiraceae bacterium]|nr:DNA methylase [Oscillospiraceae bacterium]